MRNELYLYLSNAYVAGGSKEMIKQDFMIFLDLMSK